MSRGLPHGMGPLAVGGMEACWLLIGFRILEQRVAAVGPPALLLAGLPLAFLLWRVTAAFSRPARIGIGLGAGALWLISTGLASAVPGPDMPAAARPAALFAALAHLSEGPHAAQLSAAAALSAWCCGIRLAATPIDFDRVLAEFQFGLILLVLLFFGAAQWELALPGMSFITLLFFLIFMASAAVARGSAAGSWMHAGSRGRWLSILACHAALVLGLGLLLTAAFTPEFVKTIAGLLERLWDAIVVLITGFLELLARLLPQPEITAHPPAGRGAGPMAEGANLPDLLRIPDSIRRIAGLLVAVFWTALIALSLWRIAAQLASWLRQQLAREDGAEIRSIEGAFRQDLRRLALWLWDRLRGWGAAARYLLRRRDSIGKASAEAASVRRVYLRLLAWSAARGCWRKPHHTPYEFLELLCRWLPEAHSEFEILSDYYVAVRYGDMPPGPEAVRKISAAWEGVRRIRKKRKSKEYGEAGEIAHDRR
jgi:hypothetical protein